MERSLAFFTKLGNSLTNTKKPLEEEQYIVTKETYDKKGNIVATEKLEYIGIKSIFQSSLYNSQTPTNTQTPSNKNQFNTYINYRGTTANFQPTKFANSMVSTETLTETNYTSLIKWSANKPQMILKPSDFAYHMEFPNLPVNRLLIVRRFNGGIGNDIFNTNLNGKNVQLQSTLVTWIKEDDEPFKINYNEVWQKSDESLLEVVNDLIGFKDLKILPTFQGVGDFTQNIAIQIGEKLGITTSGNNPLGDPNVLHESSIRSTEYKGLKSDFTINFKAEYGLKYIDNIDPHFAMMDIIANCVKMGTSDSKFIISPGFGLQTNEFIEELSDGNISAVMNKISSTVNDFVETFSETIKDTIDKVQNDIKDIKENGLSGSETAGVFKNAVKKYVKTSISKYKERLKGASASMTGFPSGLWHVSMGNPLNPYFSCGNLIIDSMEVQPSYELSYGDLPMKIKVQMTLKPARNLGGQEILDLFNGGKGRVYVKPEKIKTNKK